MRFLSKLLRTIKEENLENKLLKASKEGSYLEVENILKKGADANIKCEEGITALMWASYGGHTNTAALLIEYGADVGVKNNDDYTALGIAKAMGHTELTRLLKKYSVNN